ncbi:Fc receptor-like protein 3, partial [Centropristis striata]|uniref:Fc receptor-like protein 3 n=1 Tax=Centropristis striata TaxID=184440 RepID=UPI0027E0EE7C
RDDVSCALKGHEEFPSPPVYAPRLPSVSVSPSAEIVEGSSVTLTCSSDANPAANITWYKENEDSVKASGQIFTITDFRAEHSGNYYCEAQNSRGRHNSTLHLTVAAGSMKSVAAGSLTAIFLALIFLAVFLLIRRKRSQQTTNQRERPDNKAQVHMDAVYDSPSAPVQRSAAEQQDDLCYASVSFTRNQEDPLYSNIRLAQPLRHKEEEEEEEEEEEDVEYTAVNLRSASATAESRSQKAVEDSSELFGEIESIRVLHERFCAFLNFKNANMAAKALDKLQGVEMGGSKLVLRYPDRWIQSTMPSIQRSNTSLSPNTAGTQQSSAATGDVSSSDEFNSSSEWIRCPPSLCTRINSGNELHLQIPIKK